MRVSVLVGVLLIIAGAALFFSGGFTRKEKVVDIGPLEVSTEERQTVPAWVAGVVVAAGVLLVAAGSRSRTNV